MNSTSLMHKSAQALTLTGFAVTDQRPAVEAQRIVGYEVQQSPARLRAPAIEALQLRGAFLFMSVLRALVGVGLSMALLRRELLAIPQAVFKLADRHAGETLPWWPTAHKEVLATARTISALRGHRCAPFYDNHGLRRRGRLRSRSRRCI